MAVVPVRHAVLHRMRDEKEPVMGPHDEREAFLRKLAQDALEGLELNWGEAYELAFSSGDGRWSARRRDGLGGPLEARSADELHALIVADYNLKPVKRAAAHEAAPHGDSAYTMEGPRTGRLLDMRYAACWPAEGICSCGVVVRRESKDDPWEHTGRKAGE